MSDKRHPTIREMLRDHRTVHGWTHREFADATGNTVASSTITALLNREPREWPKRNEVVTGLAEALGVDSERVLLAWASSLGISVSVKHSEFTTRVPEEADDLPEDLQNDILRLIRTMVDVNGSTKKAS